MKARLGDSVRGGSTRRTNERQDKPASAHKDGRMPHITIELSANVAQRHDVDALVAAVHDSALAHGLPPADGLRTRAVVRDHYRVGDGDVDHAFVSIMARVGPGRDLGIRQSFSAALLDAAEAQVAASNEIVPPGRQPLAIAWSVELAEIDPEQRINRNHVRARLAEQSTT